VVTLAIAASGTHADSSLTDHPPDASDWPDRIHCLHYTPHRWLMAPGQPSTNR